MPQRDVKSRIERAKAATGIASEQSKIHWHLTPSWLPYPRQATPRPLSAVSREQYEAKVRECWPDIQGPEIEAGWANVSRMKEQYTGRGGAAPVAVPVPRAAPPSTKPSEDDDVDLGRIH